MSEKPKIKVALCCPTITRPFQPFLDAMAAEVPLLDAAGLDHQMVCEVGSTYISHARATMLRKALDIQPNIIVFLDHDMSWAPGSLVRLIQTPGDVVAGTYRFKKQAVEYMGTLMPGPDNGSIDRADGCIRAQWVPAGFLKITDGLVHDMMGAYPELVFGPRYRPHFDLFNHGAHKGLWYGEDYAFSRRVGEMGGEIWVIPDLDLTHHGADGTAYPGNLHRALLNRDDQREAA
jgi:glycosyltransferase involved in cell wall biosynthesis